MATRRGITSVFHHIPLARPNHLKKKKSQVAVISPPHDSAFYQIPSEVWRQVFTYLALPTHSFSFRYGVVHTYGPDLTIISEAVSSLYAITLVCRRWNITGNELLYSSPALISYHGVELFKRTLTGAPERISPLVKEIFIVQVIFRKKADLLRPFSQKNQLAKRVKADFSTITSSLPGLQKAFISLPYESLELTGWLLSQESPLCHHLRKLTLHLAPLASLDDKLTFSQLQVLCLRNITFYPSGVLANLPQLRTILFVESNFRETLIQDFLSPSSVPSLSSIEFYNTRFIDLMVDAESISCFPTLERLHLVGEDDMWTFSRLSRIQAHVPVRHLTLGIVPGFFGPLSAWRFTENLETLTLFVNLSPTVQSTVLSKKSPLDNILECLELNVDIIITSKTFRLLVVHVIPADAYVESEQFASDSLLAFCAGHDITFEYDNASEWPRRLKRAYADRLAGVDQWVMNRIADIMA